MTTGADCGICGGPLLQLSSGWRHIDTAQTHEPDPVGARLSTRATRRIGPGLLSGHELAETTRKVRKLAKAYTILVLAEMAREAAAL